MLLEVAAARVGGGPGGTVTVHGLLSGFPTDAQSLAVDAVLVALSAAYLVGEQRLRRRGRPWSLVARWCFLGGLLLLFVAVGSGLASYDDTSFPAHMSQHVLLMMAAPPLLVVGRPLRLLMQASGRPVQRVVVRAVNSWPARLLVGPLAWVLYFGTMWGYLLSPLYGDSIRIQAVHDGMHAVLLVAGLLYWESILGGDGRKAVSPVARGIGLILSAPLESGLGLILMVRLTPVYGATLRETHAGGELFWIEAMTVMGIAMAATLWCWARDDERRRQARIAAIERSAADELLEEAARVLRGGVADPGDMLIRPDEDEP